MRRFYFRRTLRIFPAYYAFLATVLVLAWTNVLEIGRWDAVFGLTYTFNMKGQQSTWWLGHTWSLAVEEQFYLMWPIAVAWFVPVTLSRLVVCGIVIPPLLRVGSLAIHPEAYNRFYLSLPFVCDPLAIGAGLALIPRDSRLMEIVQTAVGGVIGWLAPLFVVLVESLNHRPHFFPHPPLLEGVLTPLANVGLACIVVGAATVWQGRVAHLLNARLMVSVGVMSYSLYLWQMLFISPVDRPEMTFPMSLLWVVIAGSASYAFVERPMNAFRDRLVASSSGTALAHVCS